MATPVRDIQTIYEDVLANYLISMARTVENSVGHALDALLCPNLERAAALSSQVFLVEPRVNEMEMQIDDHAVRMLRTGLLGRSLGALIFRNIVLAGEVLESDDVVDRYRDQIFEHLLAGMIREPSQAAPHLQFVLATRYLERIADRATNIAEDIIFWVRGLDVRHGRARFNTEELNYPEKQA